MKTTHMVDANRQEWVVDHDSDYGGDVVIHVFPDRVQLVEADGFGNWERYLVTIPFQILKEFVGRALQDREIDLLEDELGVRFLDRVTGHADSAT